MLGLVCAAAAPRGGNLPICGSPLTFLSQALSGRPSSTAPTSPAPSGPSGLHTVSIIAMPVQLNSK